MRRNEIEVGRIYTSLATGMVVLATYNIRPVAVNGLRRDQKVIFVKSPISSPIVMLELRWPLNAVLTDGTLT